MRLLLVRHGESICSVDGIVGGERGCTGLTERGFAQTRALRDRFVREGFAPDVVLASTLPRAFQTAETIAEGLHASVQRDPELCEFVPGEIDGTRWQDYKGFDVLAEPDRPISPGGESLSIFQARVERLLGRYAKEHEGRTVLAACHGGIIFTALHGLLSIKDRSVTAEVEFTSITEWKHEGERWHLVRFNDVAHLLGSELLAPPAY
jgi:probable phosphoglycerate mutase